MRARFCSISSEFIVNTTHSNNFILIQVLSAPPHLQNHFFIAFHLAYFVNHGWKQTRVFRQYW